MQTCQSSVLLLGPKKQMSKLPNALCDSCLSVLAGKGLQRSLNPTQGNPTQLGWLASHKWLILTQGAHGPRRWEAA